MRIQWRARLRAGLRYVHLLLAAVLTVLREGRLTWRQRLALGLRLPAIAGADGAQPWTRETLAAFIAETIKPLVSAEIETALKPLREVKRDFPIPAGGGGAPAERKPPKPGEAGLRFARFVRALTASRMGLAGEHTGLRGAAYYAEHVMKDAEMARALNASNLAEGGALVPEEFVGEEFIEFLREEAVLRQLGARVVAISSDTALYPKQTGGATATYVGEGQDVPKTEQTFGQLRASARKLTALTPISNDLIRHAALGVDAMIRDDLLGAIAEKEDITFIRSAGSEHQPKGILHWTAAGNKFNANSTVNVTNVNADIVKAIRLVRAAQKRFPRRGGWMFSPRSWAFLFGALDANGNPVWREEMARGTLLGYPFRITGQIPENLGGGTDESEVYFGDFLDLVITQFGEVRVDVTMEGSYHDGSQLQSAFSRDETVVRTIFKHDLTQRYDGAFVVVQAVKWGA